jgi:hypothetical protein
MFDLPARRQLIRAVKSILITALVVALLTYTLPFSHFSPNTFQHTPSPDNLSSSEGPAFSHWNSYGVPVYDTTTRPSPPAFGTGWGSSHYLEEHKTHPSLDDVRRDHPRLFGSSQKWKALFHTISPDPYLSTWNASVFQKAARLYAQPPANYSIDGSLDQSAVLDVARVVQLRVKLWSYVYRMTGDPKWKTRVWEELIVASGNSTQYFGPAGDNWNTRYDQRSLGKMEIFSILLT